ncbi:MAG: hypothetical protein IPL28_10090 [Chloroflexi bacterium]|nr:hypothetical protein [Chloroflexota bacterium]
MVPVAPLSPSPRFVTALAANLQAWHGRTARLQTDEAIQRLNPEFPNLLRVNGQRPWLPPNAPSSCCLICPKTRS